MPTIKQQIEEGSFATLGSMTAQWAKKQEVTNHLLTILIQYRGLGYNIDIQFWPQQTAVFISKDDVDLFDTGGDFEYAIRTSIQYLERINGINK